ncbi:MAG: hypothetical protein K8E66_11620, partial [Phycisphaerales bacterium]|nr:hypothetical protein [Phycisphaerales bacterium]
MVGTSTGEGADTYVAKWQPDANFGGDGRLRCKNAQTVPDGPDFDRKIYLRFDLRGLGVSPETGELELTIADDTDGVPVSGPQVFHVYGLLDVADGVVADGLP